MEAGNGIFREKSLKRVASPEELDEYIKVTNPGVWLIFACIIIFLTGICAWGYFGTLETGMELFGEAGEGSYTVYARGDQLQQLKEGMEVKYGGAGGQITSLSANPRPAGEVIPEAMLDKYALGTDTPVYPVAVSVPLPEGGAEVRVILEQIKPMDLLFD